MGVVPAIPETVATTPPTIAVVGDLPERRAAVRRLLAAPEHRVVEAAPRDGLDLVLREQADCVLLDLGGPQSGTLEVLARLRDDAQAREVPVVVLAADDASAGALERALRAGAADYVPAPLSAERVAARVRGVLERRALRRQLQELRGRFTSLLGHDLRSPLTVITGYLQLMELSPAELPSSHRRYVTAIRGACTRMLALIGDVLDVCRLEVGALALDRAPVDVAALVAAAVERVRPASGRPSIGLGLRAAAGTAIVDGDARRLGQVVDNLLDHALRFTPADAGIAAEVWAEADTVHLTVSDAGPEIPAAELSRVLESSEGSAVRGPGSGLGLVLCRHLVGAHGGRIRVESSPAGARFVVQLPRAGGVSGPAAPAARG
jgi:signal transduction histidine kinase